MIIQMVKFKSGLTDGEVRKVIEDRAPQFRELPGLVQKYYVHDNDTGEYAGIYLWDSEESLHEFRQTELPKSIPAAYQVKGAPRVETLEVLMPLRAQVRDLAVP